MLKKKDRIIASVRKQQTRYLKRSHEFGIERHKAVEEALALDVKNGNTLYGQMLYPKRWRMSEWHLRSYKMGS